MGGVREWFIWQFCGAILLLRVQTVFENELGKKVDSINKVMKMHCETTGEDAHKLVQQCLAIRNPAPAKLGAVAAVRLGPSRTPNTS